MGTGRSGLPRRSHFPSRSPRLRPAPSPLSPHLPWLLASAPPPAAASPPAVPEGAGTRTAYLCGALRLFGRRRRRRPLRPRRGSCVSESSAAGGHSRGGARTGSGAAGPDRRPGAGGGPPARGGPRAGRGGGGGAGPQGAWRARSRKPLKRDRVGGRGWDEAEVSPTDCAARLSRGRKRMEAGGSFGQWQSADTEGFRCEPLRGELKRAGKEIVFSEHFLLRRLVWLGRLAGRKVTEEQRSVGFGPLLNLLPSSPSSSGVPMFRSACL